VMTQGAYLAKDGNNIVVRIDREVKLRILAHTLGGVVCFGNVTVSPFLMGHCAENGVLISFLTEQGRFLGRVHGPQTGNVRLRRAQHEATRDPETASQAAQLFITAKLWNTRTMLQRALRDHANALPNQEIRSVINKLAGLIRQLRRPMPVDRIRGVEGDAAHSYFSVLDHLILMNKEAFRFTGRERRPPCDPFNAVLSYIYTLMAHDASAACQTVGLDPQMGFLHADRSGRASLALDLMEELRPFADRLALTLINRSQVTPSGFQTTETGAVMMDEATRRAVIDGWTKRKADEIHHPFLNEKIRLGWLPWIQSRLLARWLRGDLDEYPPYFWR
jgi:CRISP-associated protein Cas1